MAARSARALVVELVADATDFVKGTQKADDALSDFVADTEQGVRDINNATDKLGQRVKDPFEKVGTSAKDAADDADRAFDNLAREAKASFRKVEQAADQAGHDVGKESFGEAGKEAGGEFTANLSETLSSGDYSGLGRDTAAGLVSGFAAMPGIGLALAPLAGAAALVFGQMAKSAADKAALIEQSFQNAASSVLASLATSTRGQQFTTIIEQLGGGTPGKGLDKIAALAKQAGINVVDFKEAMIAGGAPLEVIRKRLVEVEKKGQGIRSNWRTANTETAKAATAAEKLSGVIGTMEGSLDRGAEQAGILNSKLGDKQMKKAVDERAGSIRQQTADLNSSAAAAERARAALIDPRINIAIDERTRTMHKQEVQASKTAAAVRGIPGTVVGGKVLKP
jgi:hypothetical protein